MFARMGSGFGGLGIVRSVGNAARPPTSFSGLLRWHSAQPLALSNGAAVAALPDLSPANDPAVQATGASKPIYSTTAANGRPGITLNGTSHILNFTAVSNVQTAIVVASLADQIHPTAAGQGVIANLSAPAYAALGL
jgi:hypothetical protein